jgi:hypothetical protein
MPRGGYSRFVEAPEHDEPERGAIRRTAGDKGDPSRSAGTLKGVSSVGGDGHQAFNVIGIPMSIVVNENDVTRLKAIKMEKGCSIGCAVASDPKNPGIRGEGSPGNTPDPIPAQVVGVAPSGTNRRTPSRGIVRTIPLPRET